MNFQMRNGKQVEDLVEVVCTKMFFSDFTVRNPKYTKNDNLEKEAADLLIPFGEYLLAFQVKSKEELKKASEKTDTDFRRIARVAHKAVDQLKTIKRVIDNDWLNKLTTVKGYEIPFPTSSFKKIIGIVILDLIGEDMFPDDERTKLIGNYIFEHNMPIHILMRYEFEAISTELDTLPDFIKFLDKRKILIERSLFFPFTSILDFLAFYKINPDKVDHVIDNDIHLYLEDKIWENYLDTHSDKIKQRNAFNEPSYFIDAIIDYLHTSVGFSLSDEIIIELGLKSQGSLEGYLTVVRELASLSRLERRILGERLLRCMKLADSQEQSYSMIFLEYENSAYLVLSMAGKRSKRRFRLYQLCAMAYCYFNAEKIIGIATEELLTSLRSYDVVGLKGTKFENHEELAEQAKSFFNKPYKPEITEYKGRNNLDA